MESTATGWSRRLAAGAGLLAALACLPACAADLLDSVKSRGTLRVAMEGSYPPFNFIDEKTGQMNGYDADVARLLGARLGLRVELLSTEWAAIFDGLADGKYDIIVSQVSITPMREQRFDFSTPYTYSSVQLILRKNDEARYASVADLKGKLVGVAKGSIYEAQMQAVPGVTLRSYPAVAETLQDLAFGRVDAAVNDSLLVAYLVSRATLPLKAGPTVGRGERIGAVIKKGNPALKAAIDQAIHRAQADGSLTKLSQKWFHVDASRPPL